MFKKNNLHKNFVETFLNLSNISFTSFESKGVNRVLQEERNLASSATEYTVEPGPEPK